uniref:Uncharacterized protein n=1 Tax=Oryctolagus cuniculus TaxID=9986 RepID=A0A5F9D6Z5_RABIT
NYREVLRCAHVSQLHGKFFSLVLFQLGSVSHGFWTQDIVSPAAKDLIVSVLVVGLDGFHQLSQSLFVFQVDLCEGSSGAGLPVDQVPQPGLFP